MINNNNRKSKWCGTTVPRQLHKVDECQNLLETFDKTLITFFFQKYISDLRSYFQRPIIEIGLSVFCFAALDRAVKLIG